MASGIIVAQQHHILVVYRLGKLEGIAGPGFRFLLPFLYKGRKVDIREEALLWLNPHDADDYAVRALAYASLGKDESSQRDVRQAVELGFDHALLEDAIATAKNLYRIAPGGPDLSH